MTTGGPQSGLLACALGVLGFSGTTSATRAVVLGAGPWVAALGRVAVAAAAVAGLWLMRGALRRAKAGRAKGTKEAKEARAPSASSLTSFVAATAVSSGSPSPAPRWTRGDRLRLVWVAAAIVTAFPVLHALATVKAQAQEMTLLGGALPLMTAILGRIRSKQRALARVWLGAGLGTAALCAFAIHRGDPQLGKSFLLGAAAIAAAAFGYAEGAVLARRFGAYAVISKAVLVGLLLDVAVLAAVRPSLPTATAIGTWAALTRPAPLVGLLYLGLVSMLLAYVAWYDGLARAGVTRGALVQLAQVPLGLAWSWALLGEPVGRAELATAAAVLLSLRIALRAPHIAPAVPAAPDLTAAPALITAPAVTPAPALTAASDLITAPAVIPAMSQPSSPLPSRSPSPFAAASSAATTSSFPFPEIRS